MASLRGLTCQARDNSTPPRVELLSPRQLPEDPATPLCTPRDAMPTPAVQEAPTERGSCFATRLLGRLMAWLELEEVDDYDEEGKVDFTVSTAASTVNVGCYGDESVSDLLARMAHLSTEAEQANLCAATLRVETPTGARVCATTRLADLGPNPELVLNQSLSDAAGAKVSDDTSTVTGPSSPNSPRSTDIVDGDDAVLGKDELCVPLSVCQVASFVDEPHLGTSLLIRTESGRSPEKLVCFLTF